MSETRRNKIEEAIEEDRYFRTLMDEEKAARLLLPTFLAMGSRAVQDLSEEQIEELKEESDEEYDLVEYLKEWSNESLPEHKYEEMVQDLAGDLRNNNIDEVSGDEVDLILP